MPDWRDINNYTDGLKIFRHICQQIQQGSLKLGRHHYAHSLAVGVLEAILCRYGRIAAIELGVARGDGLLDLCRAAQFFRTEFSIDIRVYEFDNAAGLPAPRDHRDHPEMWAHHQFNNNEAIKTLPTRLPDFAELVIGDVATTIPAFLRDLPESVRIGFVALDVDQYSSAKAALALFCAPPEKYLPAVPLYVDDIDDSIMYNDWCGEQLAINEFNYENALRKIQRNDAFKIRKFHALHVLDHPLRTGAQRWSPGLPIFVPPLL